MAKLTASDGEESDGFGFSVSIGGNFAIVGAPSDNDNGSGSGSAYIYALQDGSWNEVIKLTASDGAANDIFGFSVSISDEIAIVGAYGDDDNEPGSGSAYIYERQGSTWNEAAKLTASDRAGLDRFGYRVSNSGDLAIVGAPGDDDNGADSGSAYIYERQGSTWNEVAKLTASDGAFGDFFGSSISISDDLTIVAAPFDDDNGD